MNPLRGLAITGLMIALGCGGDSGGADASAANGQSGASGQGGVGATNAGAGGSGAIGGMSSGGMTAVSSGGTSNSGGASGVGSGGIGGTSVGTGGAQADRLARAAAVVGSCIPDDGINRNLSYMWYPTSTVRFWGHFGSQAECLATHGGGCAAVVACVGWELAPSTESCTTTGCDGDTFTYCEDGFRLQQDCSKLGLQCDSAALCSESPATACDSDTFVNTCDADSIPLICDDGATHIGPDCPAFGLGCTDGSCVGLGAVCTGGGHSYQGDIFYDGIRCDGSTLIACVDGREHRLDCPSVADGFSCQTHEGKSFCGIASECTPAAPAEGSGPDEACEGDEVVFCNAGRVQRVDCVALGFEGCDVEAGQGCVPGPAEQ